MTSHLILDTGHHGLASRWSCVSAAAKAAVTSHHVLDRCRHGLLLGVVRVQQVAAEHIVSRLVSDVILHSGRI